MLWRSRFVRDAGVQPLFFFDSFPAGHSDANFVTAKSHPFGVTGDEATDAMQLLPVDLAGNGFSKVPMVNECLGARRGR